MRAMPDTQVKTTATHKQKNRALALAALAQCVYLVDGIARKGNIDGDDFHNMVGSLFASNDKTSPDTIYGDLPHLQTGLRIALTLLKGDPLPQAKHLLTYSAGLFALEKKLRKEPRMRQTIATGIQRCRGQADYFGSFTHESVIAGIAGLYAETISTLSPRIIVRGKPEYLRSPAITNKVRTLLLAGIRAAHLWRKYGGNHLQLVFTRKKLVRQMQHLLQNSTPL